MALYALHQFLLLYFWLGVAALLLFWGLLARYYQRFSGRCTFYRLLLAPVLLGSFVSVRYASNPFGARTPLEEAAGIVAAIVLIALTTRATFYMLRRD